MSTMTLPTGWVYYDSGTGWVKFARGLHSVSNPNTVTFKRTESKDSSGVHTSRYQVNMAAGVNLSVTANSAASAANAVLPNSLIKFEMRNVEGQLVDADEPITGQPGIVTMLNELGALITSPTFQEDIAVTLLLPTP